MGSEWRWRTLGELTDNFDSIRVPVKEPDRRPGPHPYYGASGVVDHVDRYLYDGEYLLVAEDGENLRTRTTPVAFLARGQFWVNNHAHVIRGNTQADTRFLMYALSAADISGYLSGSTMPKLTQANLNRIPLSVPGLAEQRRIADILSSLDDKIELNRRMSQTLESVARAHFKSWFIDFDPVRARSEGKETGLLEPLERQFPDSFEPLDPSVPRGWARQTVQGVCDLVGRGVTPEYGAGSGRYVINQRVNRGSQLDWTALKELSASLEVPSDRYACKWDVLVNCLGEGTLGRVHLFKGASHR